MKTPPPHPEFVDGIRYHLDQFIATARECYTTHDDADREVFETLFEGFMDPEMLQDDGVPLPDNIRFVAMSTMLTLAISELAKRPVQL